MASIADTFVTVLAETSQVAPKIKEAFRKVDNDARQAGERWSKEISNGLGTVKVKVDADTAKARAEIDAIDGKEVTVKVKTDASGLPPFLGGGGGGSGFGGSGGGGALKLNVGLVGIGLLPAAATAITDVAGSIQQLAGAGLALPGIFAGLASSVGVAALGMHGMKDALEAVNKAADGTKASVEAANTALAGLAPNQAEAVKAVAGLKGTFTDLRNIAGQNLFANFSGDLRTLAAATLPSVTKGIDGISRGLNTNLRQTMKSLGSDSSKGFMTRIFGNTADSQAILSNAIDPLVHAFGTLTAAGSDTLPRLATAIGNIAERFNAFITNADRDGRLSKWINDGLTGFTHLGNIVLDIGKSFTALTQASGGGAGFLSMLETATSKMEVFLNSTAGQQKLRDFFQQGRDMLGQLKDIAVQLAPVLGGVFNAGIGAANLWLPVIRQVLTTINAIPGGAAAVVGAFALWKTMQGPIALINSLNTVMTLLKVALPAAAAEGSAGISSGITAGLAGITLPGWMTAILGVAGGAASLVAITTGFGYVGDKLLHNAPNSNENARARGAQGLAGVNDQARPTNPQDPMSGGGVGAHGRGSGTGNAPLPPQASTTWGFQPPPGSPAAAAAGPAPSGLGHGSSLVITPGVTTPNLSTYAPPVITEVPKTSGTPNLPYAGTADPYASMTPAGGYTSDAALLASVPSGQYTQGQRGDLTKGLADCSSAVEDLVNLMDGRSTAGASMSTGNEAAWLTAHGFVQGMGGPGDFRVGFNSGHTQATLPGGTNFNWGSQAAAASGGVAPNSGAYDPAFTSHFYRPAGGGDPMSTMYGGGMTPGGGLTSGDLSLRNAQQRINDTQHSEEQAQGRLNELKAKGTATDRQMEAAEYALAKAKREHQDAIDGLTVAQDKYNKAQSGTGKGGNSDVSSLGGDLFGGVLQAIGLDGSLFKNPFESGMWKGLTGVANFAGGLAEAKSGMTGGTGSLIPGGGSGGGLGGLLGMASSFMPGMPGGTSTNLLDAVQNAQTGGPASPGPGNNPGPVFDMRGSNLGVDPAGFQQTVTDMTTSQNRWAPLAQNLPH